MYLLTIPFSIALYFTVRFYSKKLIGKEPTWLKFLALIALAVITLTPVIIVSNVANSLNWADTTRVYTMLGSGLIAFLLTLKTMTKQQVIEKDGVREWS